MARRTGIVGVFAALLALVLALAAPAALAHHKDNHSKGGGKAGSGGETVTEGNDADGVPNAPDPEGDADNKHPSGKDKHEEAGGSGNQGNSQSDPDDDGRGPDRSNGGADKPDGPGGDDMLDQDGNNGCGNDDDFEDDNEGWCGKPDRSDDDGDDVQGGRTEKTCPNGDVMPANEKCSTETPTLPCDKDDDMTNGIQVCEDDEVEADVDEQPVVPAVLGTRFTAAPEVAGAAVAPAAVAPAVGAAAETEGAVLPFTGNADLVPFVAIGLLLIVAGALGLRRRVTN